MNRNFWSLLWVQKEIPWRGRDWGKCFLLHELALTPPHISPCRMKLYANKAFNIVSGIYYMLNISCY